MNNWILIPLFLPVLIAALVIYRSNRQTKKTMDTINRMLDAAVQGSYTETTFDESRLSALETKFAHYLSASAASAKNVSIEKDKIKTLISDISHQTKTPIANLLLYSELLAEEELPEELHSNVEAIRQQTEKLRFLIDSLVKLSRLENGILTLFPQKQSIQPMLEDIYEQYAAKAKSKGLQLLLTVSEAESCAEACFDRKWTAEALGNIVDNAIKYTEQGSVAISVASYELFTRINVTDTGIGIQESEQPKIFSRFYRSETVCESEGVGIGLYLAREIVSSEGGYIKLSSERKKGSTFSVFLPK